MCCTYAVVQLGTVSVRQPFMEIVQFYLTLLQSIPINLIGTQIGNGKIVCANLPSRIVDGNQLFEKCLPFKNLPSTLYVFEVKRILDEMIASNFAVYFNHRRS